MGHPQGHKENQDFTAKKKKKPEDLLKREGEIDKYQYLSLNNIQTLQS